MRPRRTLDEVDETGERRHTHVPEHPGLGVVLEHVRVDGQVAELLQRPDGKQAAATQDSVMLFI